MIGPPPHRTLLAVLALALLAGGCTSGDDADAPSTTTAPPATTAPRATDGGRGPTAAQLAALLPPAADLGPDWVPIDDVDDPTSDAASTDRALAEQCPALATVLEADQPTAGRADHVVRRYVDGDGREVVVDLDPSPRMRTDRALREAVDDTNGCGAVVAEDRDGVTTTLRLQAAIDPDHGEQALKFQAAVEVQLPSEDEPISLNQYGLAFRTASVGVRITATDGIDAETLDVRRTDVDLLAALSERLEASVDDLSG